MFFSRKHNNDTLRPRATRLGIGFLMRISPVSGVLLVVCLWLFEMFPCRVRSEESSLTNQACSTVVELRQAIDTIVAHPRYEQALWGISIRSLDTGKSLYEHAAGKLFSPASITKLFTVAAALDRFGSRYRIKTSLCAGSKPSPDGVLKGNLVVYGRGDPTIATRFRGGGFEDLLEPFVRALSTAGVRKVEGDLVADLTFFKGPEAGSGWSWDDLDYYYGAEISALSIEDNVVRAKVIPDGRIGGPCSIMLSPPSSPLVLSNLTRTLAATNTAKLSWRRLPGENLILVSGGLPIGGSNAVEFFTVHEPAKWFINELRRKLDAERIAVTGRCRMIQWPGITEMKANSMLEIGTVESLPLTNIIHQTVKVSQNLYTDLLLAHLGETRRSTDDWNEATSEELGIRELEAFLSRAGIDSKDYFFEEGSGLSRDTLVCPRAVVRLLEFMAHHPESRCFVEAFPVAGVDGSLRNRMKGTSAVGKVRAKTGSLRWSTSLSGYTQTAAGENLEFCLMLNRYAPPLGHSAPEDLDRIAVLLSGLQERSK